MRAPEAEALLWEYFQESDEPERGFRERVEDALARIGGERTRADLEGWLELDWLSVDEPPTEAVRALNLPGEESPTLGKLSAKSG